jgi:hypothetical protein
MDDEELGDAVLLHYDAWVNRTVLRRKRDLIGASAIVAATYIVMAAFYGLPMVYLAQSMVMLLMLISASFALGYLSLWRCGAVPGLYERGLVSVRGERVLYEDVRRIELRGNDVHVVHIGEADERGREPYVFFPRRFLSDEGVEEIRGRANAERRTRA